MKLSFKSLLFILPCCGLFWACQKSSRLKGDLDATVERNIDIPLVSYKNEWSDNPYKVNVVYFIPNDHDSVENFRERISGILLHAQSFFAENMERWGYGRKSFGLDFAAGINVADSTVNIITIIGKEGKASYPYNGGGYKIIPEVNAYFAAHPELKKSDHYLVIVPSTTGDPTSPGGVPFYGIGRFAFALDYEYLDMKYIANRSWIGGLVHELGHGLNGPHNYGTLSLTAAHGRSLMGSGNATYGKQPTFITPAVAAVFNSSQTFSTEQRTDWHQDFNFRLESLQSSVSNGKIILSGRFTASQTIRHALAFFDREGNGEEDRAVSFSSAVINGDSLYIECPLSEFPKRSGSFKLSIRFIAANGLRKEAQFLLDFENNMPNLQKVFQARLRNRQAWTITSSGDQSGSPVSYVLDNDFNTAWHTPWRPTLTNHPHWFAIDMQAPVSFNTLAMHNRSNVNGALKDFYVKTSSDGTTWNLEGQFTLPQNSGANYVPLNRTISARYVKIESINSHGGHSYTHMSEFDVLLR